MLDHYLHTARRAHGVLYPGRQRVDLGRPRALVTPEGFAAKPFALAWLRAEYQVLLKIIDLAAREGFDDARLAAARRAVDLPRRVRALARRHADAPHRA